MNCPNNCQKQVNSIFVCLVLILLFIFLTGCHTIEYKWFPKKSQKEASISYESRDRKELGGIEVDVLKITRKK
jgi:hypothetical protein